MHPKLFGQLVSLVFLAASLQAGATWAADPIVLHSVGCKTEYFLLQELAAAYTAKNGRGVYRGRGWQAG